MSGTGAVSTEQPGIIHMSPHASTKAVGSDRDGIPSSCLPPVTFRARKVHARKTRTPR